MRKVTCLIGLFVAVGLFAQDKKAMKYAKTISSADLKAHLTVIASDEYEGRETGKEGQKKAATYISTYFKNLGLEGPVDGSYYQTFDLASSGIATAYFRKGEDKKLLYEDFIYYSSSETYGEEYINVMLVGENEEKGSSYKNRYIAYVTEELGGLQERIDFAKENGAKGFIVFLTSDSEFRSTLSRFTPYLQQSRLRLGSRNNQSDKMIIADKAVAEWMFGKKFDELVSGEKAQLIFNADYLDKPVSTENVLGFLRGTEKPDEVLIITAHYDHVGIINGEIHNGADDDGSGTVTVLELAEAFVEANKKGTGPKRSILFMTVTGEEKGLLGSRYYTDHDPVFPLENTVANLNIDMIGRVDGKHTDNPEYVYLIGSDKLSQNLHDLSEAANSTYTKLELDYTYNDENDPNRFYYRSDHYNFAKNNIPIIFYFNGTHPDYHRPTDTIEKINFEVMQQRARLIFYTAWEVANREERVKVNKLEGG